MRPFKIWLIKAVALIWHSIVTQIRKHLGIMWGGLAFLWECPVGRSFRQIWTSTGQQRRPPSTSLQLDKFEKWKMSWRCWGGMIFHTCPYLSTTCNILVHDMSVENHMYYAYTIIYVSMIKKTTFMISDSVEKSMVWLSWSAVQHSMHECCDLLKTHRCEAHDWSRQK